MRSYQRMLLSLVLSGTACGAYLLASALSGGIGFPLDDAWIHQTYARSLGTAGDWAFIPGQPSAGSTSPLWTGLLSVGYFLRVSPYVWTFALGWLSLAAVSFLGMEVFSRLCPDYKRWLPAAGILLALEWHLVWAAVSGMETILYSLFILGSFALVLMQRPPWLVVGALVGLCAWVRPDGITLLGPVILVLIFQKTSWQSKGKGLLVLAAGFSLFFLTYLYFNRSISGSVLPNTFFAKQAEYTAELESSLMSRLGEQMLVMIAGVGALLLPGFAAQIVDALRKRTWGILAGALWVAGYLGMYALRLPVTYQHGRYVIPAMPVFALWGTAGMLMMLSRPAPRAIWCILGKSWAVSSGVVLLLFSFIGMSAYARDVRWIESEMVSTARWVAGNTPPGALVAAHDIGALGYFGNRPLLDMAGLVSPEVIPFIRDEARLADYLDSAGVDYLVTFPGWYPELVRRRGEKVFRTAGTLSLRLGGENMAVFRWRSPPPE